MFSYVENKILYFKFFYVNRTVYLCCSLLVNISFLLLLFFNNHLKVEKPTKRQVRRHTYTQKHTLRVWKKKKKKRKKSENPISAPCSEACAVHRESEEREKEIFTTFAYVHTSVQKTHTFTILLVFFCLFQIFFHVNVYITNVIEYFLYWIYHSYDLWT
jgi:hypothetical protein